MTKTELRKIYKEKRTNLSKNQIDIFQTNIYNQIYQLEFTNFKNIHIFLTLQKFNEIDTQPIIKFLQNKGKRLIVSACNFANNSLTHFYLEENTILKPNKFGVLEPVGAKQVLENNIDLVFVPLLISDINNFRVGYGKGFYDRFLVNCKPSTKFIGLNFFKPIQKINDINKFDIALHRVIYPK